MRSVVLRRKRRYQNGFHSGSEHSQDMKIYQSREAIMKCTRAIGMNCKKSGVFALLEHYSQKRNYGLIRVVPHS